MRLRRPRTVRNRLLLVIVLSVAAALALMTAGFNVVLWQMLSHDADNLVKARAAAEVSSLRVVGGKLITPEAPDNAGIESQSWVFVGSESVEEPRVDPALTRAAASAAATPGQTVDVAGRQTRLYATPVVAGGKRLGTVVAGVALGPYERTRHIALVGSLLFAGALLLIVTLVSRWMLAAALHPVARMTADAEVWSVNQPDRRFAAGAPNDELSQLAATLDGLLDRLAASLRREERFSAELSHELRTPLAKICVEAELALRRERTPEAYRETLATVLRHARQLTRAVDTLVLAARQESGLGRGSADVDSVLQQAADACARLAEEHGVAISVEPAALSIGVEADVAARVLQPVVENACQHAHGSVRISAGREAADVVIVVADDGPGVAPEDTERIFAPGVRGGLDEAAAQSPGAGLGLALARRLARATSGDVEVDARAVGGRFSVRLPAG
jgi:two-component system OmpR family sensor kinase